MWLTLSGLGSNYSQKEYQRQVEISTASSWVNHYLRIQATRPLNQHEQRMFDVYYQRLKQVVNPWEWSRYYIREAPTAQDIHRWEYYWGQGNITQPTRAGSMPQPPGYVQRKEAPADFHLVRHDASIRTTPVSIFDRFKGIAASAKGITAALLR